MKDDYIEPSDFGLDVGGCSSRAHAMLYFVYPTRYAPSVLTAGFSPDQCYRASLSRDVDFSTGSQIREKYFLGSLQSIDYVTTPLSAINGWRDEDVQEAHPATETINAFVIPPKSTMPRYTIGVLMLQVTNDTEQLIRGIHVRDIDDMEALLGSDTTAPVSVDVDKTESERNWNPYDSISAFDVKYLLIRTYNRLVVSCKNSIDFPMHGRIIASLES